MPRVGIYARVSSDHQEKEHTIGSQLDALRLYAQDKGEHWTGPEVVDNRRTIGSLPR